MHDAERIDAKDVFRDFKLLLINSHPLRRHAETVASLCVVRHMYTEINFERSTVFKLFPAKLISVPQNYMSTLDYSQGQQGAAVKYATIAAATINSVGVKRPLAMAIAAIALSSASQLQAKYPLSA